MPQDDTNTPADASETDTGAAAAGDDTASADTAATDGVDASGNGANLSALLAAAEARADAEHEAFLRARADFANFKRRTEEEREATRTFVTAELVKRFLPIIDNFERALAAAETTRDYDKLVSGVNAVYRQFQDLLTKEGVEAIDAAGQPFDPNLHNAVLREETTEHPENTVIEDLQKGYTLKGKVLRPTMVKVASGDA